MKTLIAWLILVLVLAVGVSVFLVSKRRNTQAELKRVDKLEQPSEGPIDATAAPFVTTATSVESARVRLERKAQELNDSLDLLSSDLEDQQGGISSDQSRRLNLLGEHARRLDSLAHVLRTLDLPDDARIELYRVGVETYGAGAAVNRQLRAEVGLKRK